MNKGLIEERGFPEDIYSKPESEYTQKLIDAIPKGSLDAIKAEQLKRKIRTIDKEESETI